MMSGEVYQAGNLENADKEIFDSEKVDSNNLTVMDGKAVLDPEEIKAEDTKENRAVLDRVRERMGEIESNYWFLCSDLFSVRENHLFELEDHATFAAYAENQCNIKKRMAHYYCRIHEFFKKDLLKMMADQPEKYQKVLDLAPTLGLTRCLKIAHSKNVTSDNLYPLMQSVALPDGRLKTVRDVEEMLSDLGGELEAPPESSEEIENPTVDKSVRFTVSLEDTQSKHVESALEIAAGLSNNKKKSINLANICSEFIANHPASGDRKKSLKKHLSGQEEFLGLTLVALDNGKGKVIYGPKQLNTLLKMFETCLGVSLVAFDTEKNETVYGREFLEKQSESDSESDSAE